MRTLAKLTVSDDNSVPALLLVQRSCHQVRTPNQNKALPRFTGEFSMPVCPVVTLIWSTEQTSPPTGEAGSAREEA